ncbi:MAG: D-inositol-3-phosphate glycosyltransferase [Phycisphaerae bacterium]|nr:D-inositol-3-phosphate glycosyltransferase [Phycisphaerae bacterium]
MTDRPHTTSRLLYVITDLQVGGVPLHLFRLARAMRDRGYTLLVVSLAPPGPVSALLEEAGISTFSCQARSTLDLLALWRLRTIIVRFQPDWIHSFLFHANIACRLVAPLAGIPPRRLINEIQTVEIERRWHLTLDRWTHWLCGSEIGNSPSVINHLHKVAGLPIKKLHLLPGGVEIERFEQAIPYPKSTWKLNDRDHLLLWVGRLDPIKGLNDLLRALHILIQHHSCHLLLAGDGPERDPLHQLAVHLGLEQSVTFLGVRQDIARLMKSADLFVFPSYTEGLPNALLEAQAAELPIVCTAVSGNLDVVPDEEHGWLVPPAQPEKLAQALQSAVTNQTKHVQKTLRSKARLRSYYSFNSMIDKYIQHYFTIQ